MVDCLSEQIAWPAKPSLLVIENDPDTARLSTVIFELDTQGQIRFLSSAWHRLLSFSIEESLEQPFCKFLHPDDCSGYQASLNTLLRRQATCWKFEARTINKHGEVLWTEIVLETTSQPKNPTSIFGRLVDITERKRTQQ